MSDTNTSLQVRKPRDMYYNLYLKNNRDFGEAGPLPTTEMNEDWLKPNAINFAELFATVEYRAVLKIRLLFFEWAEKGLVKPAIDNAHLFE